MSDDALLARLERLETAEAARAVLFRYAHGVDNRDWELLGSCFTDDAVLDMAGTEFVGRAAIVDAMKSMLPDEFITRHLIVNPQVEWRAPGRSTVRAVIYYRHEGTGFEALGWGEYVDEVIVVDGVASISRKTFIPSQHLPGSAGSVSRRTERLETIEAARDAAWRYAQAVDTLDFDLLRQVFTDDAELTTRKGPRKGREVVVEYYRTALADPVQRRHFITNPRVEWTAPGEATLTSLFLYTFSGADTSTIGWGRYTDHVRVTDGVGYIAAKTIQMDLSADARNGWAAE